MKKNIILLIISILFLTGCTSEYTLEISNKKIKENITVDILDSDIPDKSTGLIAEIDDSITPFIENDQYPFMNNTEIKYKKKVTNIDGGKRVNLKYTYSHDDFKDSKAFNMCFEKKDFKKLRKGFSLNFSGKFYCSYTDEVVIKIKTDNVVVENNADEVKGNTYIWRINSDNVDDVDINIELSNKVKYTKYAITAVLAIIGIIALIVIVNVYKIIKARENVNDI